MSQMLETKRHGLAATQASVQARPSNELIKNEARTLWFNELSNWSSSHELVDYIAGMFLLDVSVINVWRIFDRWPDPRPNIHTRTQVSVFEEDDPMDLANDPLDGFYEHHIEIGNRRSALNYVHNAGFIGPSEIDLDLVQDLLDRFPIALEDLCAYLCVEPEIFIKYARANGITESRPAYLNQPIISLLYRHEQLKGIVSAHSQHLYRSRAIPIRIMARRMNLRWKDLWALGSEKGYWQHPSSAVLMELDALFHSRKT